MATDEADGESNQQWQTVHYGKHRPPAQAAQHPESGARDGSRYVPAAAGRPALPCQPN